MSLGLNSYLTLNVAFTNNFSIKGIVNDEIEIEGQRYALQNVIYYNKKIKHYGCKFKHYDKIFFYDGMKNTGICKELNSNHIFETNMNGSVSEFAIYSKLN